MPKIRERDGGGCGFPGPSLPWGAMLPGAWWLEVPQTPASGAWQLLALCWLTCGLSHLQPTGGEKLDQVLPPPHTLKMEMWPVKRLIIIATREWSGGEGTQKSKEEGPVGKLAVLHMCWAFYYSPKHFHCHDSI